MNNSDKVLVTLYFEGAKHLTKVRDEKPTKLESTITDAWGPFAGCNKHSVDVELQAKDCRIEISLTKEQVDTFPSRSALRSLGINPRDKRAEKQWMSLSLEARANVHAQDRAHDKGAINHLVQIM